MELHLEKITYLNWHDVEDLCVSDEQRAYVADNVSSLALAGVIRAAMTPHHRFAVQFHVAAFRLVQQVQAAQEKAFCRFGRTEHGDDVAFADFQGEVAETVHAVAVLHADSARREDDGCC